MVDKNGFFWHRAILSTDWKFGKRIILFTEFNSALTSSRSGGIRPSIDYNEFDLNQLYLQFIVGLWTHGNLKIKVGRQMYPLGSQRLITTREGPNNRLSFNGASLIYKHENFTITSFLAQPVYNKSYVFDDSVVQSQTVWGVNFAHQQKDNTGKWELYYYGYSNSNIQQAGKFGKDIRYSVGLFYTFAKNGWELEAEPVFQLGKFNTETVVAYSIFSQIQKKILLSRIAIIHGLSLAAFSGDANSKDNLSSTYNPMYPKPPFGLIAPLGPVNLLVVNPRVTISPNVRWQCSIASDIYWRYSHDDGLYTPAVNPAIRQIYPADEDITVHSKFIGQDFIVNAYFKMAPYVLIGFEGGYFKTGDYLKQTGKGKNILYCSGLIKFDF